MKTKIYRAEVHYPCGCVDYLGSTQCRNWRVIYEIVKRTCEPGWVRLDIEELQP